jgi:starch synthase
MSARICMISSEVAPLAKTGGLADVVGALAKYLHGVGHDVRVFMPLYSAIDRARFATRAVDALQNLPLSVGPHSYRYSVVEARLPGTTAPVFLIDCPVLYARNALYTWDADEHLRFLALTRAALECCQHMDFSPQILHCNDWHAAFGPLFLKTLYGWDRLFESTRSVLTIHNIGYQGVFSASAVGDLQLGGGSYLLHQDDLRAGFINPLKHGIMYADAITTVSPTYAREITTAEYGMGLEHVLQARGDAVLGILNGVDYDEWDPRTDPYLPRHYDPAHLGIKAELKGELLARLALTSNGRVPLAGLVSRLVAQKGIDLLAQALPQVLATRELACVVLGSGEASYESAVADLQQRFPGRVAFRRGYDEELAHWIEAGSDLFVMPSRYEPCGLNQMYSLRYGTVPLVRRTGGLADSVALYDPASGRGTGVLFGPATGQALADALHTTLDLYAQPAHWRRMARNGMAQDFSWARQGAHYGALYERLMAQTRA